MATEPSALQVSVPIESSSSNFDRAMSQEEQENKTSIDDENPNVDAPRETIANSEVSLSALTSSPPNSVADSTSNVAQADSSDWNLLLTALISRRSTSLDSDGYLKLCESSSNLKTMADWRQYYEKYSRRILAVLKCRRIVGPAQFAQSPELNVALPPLDNSKLRVRSRLPLILQYALGQN